MSHGFVFESIEAARPHPRVAAALNDDVEGAGLVGPAEPDTFIGSRLFNVASAAMASLREEPGVPVIERLIEAPEPEDWLGRFTLRLLNDSVRQAYYAKIPYRLASPAVEAVDAGPEVEQKLLDGVGDLDTDPDAYYTDEGTGLLFIDKSGKPVAFKQDPVTITFKPVQINAIRYPAGTLLNLQESEDIAIENLGNLDVARFHQDSIESAAALRFSPFAFKPENRQQAIEPIAGHEIAEGLLPVFALGSLAHVINSFPDQPTLTEVYADIRHGDEELTAA